MFTVAIASRHRHDVLAKYTYPLLLKGGILPSEIVIFVNDQEDAESYKKQGFASKIVVTHKQGIGENRNFITDFFPVGTHLVFADDDIKRIVQLVGYRKAKPVEDVRALIEKGFMYCSLNKSGLWGVSPTANHYFMRSSISTNLKFIWSSFFGVIVDHDPALKITVIGGDLDDHERTIKYYLKYGKVVRLNMYGFEADYQGIKGGMRGYRDAQVRLKNAQMLTKTYPKLCSIFYKKSSPLPELRLRDRR